MILIRKEAVLENEASFVVLLEQSVKTLKLRFTPQNPPSPSSKDFETLVCEVMKENAAGTVFCGKIKLVAGQKFPDITAMDFFGVEVKTTIQDHWRTTGNSVLETTRIDKVEQIYLLFGKLFPQNPDFKFRKYQDCLYDVAVTHSPRYLIDMNLSKGQTIFDKIKIPYDKLRVKEAPVASILAYYKKDSTKNPDAWWLKPDGTEVTSSLSIRLWSELQPDEKRSIAAEGFAFFPEIFSKKQDKFNRFTLWCIKEHNLLIPNVRDIYTAGGQVTLTLNGTEHTQLPALFKRLLEDKQLVASTIRAADRKLFEQMLGVKLNPDCFEKRVEKWGAQVSKTATQKNKTPLKRIIDEIVKIKDSGSD